MVTVPLVRWDLHPLVIKAWVLLDHQTGHGLDIQEGGDCHLIRQFLLTNATEAGITEAELARQEQQHLELTGGEEGAAARKISNETGDETDYQHSRYHTEITSGEASPN